MASEAQNKYERELMLHAADVEALQIAKEQVSTNAQVRQKLEDTSQRAEAQMVECKAAKAEIERILKVSSLGIWVNFIPGCIFVEENVTITFILRNLLFVFVF